MLHNKTIRRNIYEFLVVSFQLIIYPPFYPFPPLKCGWNKDLTGLHNVFFIIRGLGKYFYNENHWVIIERGGGLFWLNENYKNSKWDTSTVSALRGSKGAWGRGIRK